MRAWYAKKCAPTVPPVYPPSSITFKMWRLFWVQALSILRIGARCFGYRRKVVRSAGRTGLRGSWYGFRGALELDSGGFGLMKCHADWLL